MAKPTKSVLHQKYIIEHKTTAQIGVELNYSQTRISQLLREYGIQTRKTGSSTIENLTGKKFGKLTAIERIRHSKKGTLWLCKCDCGRTKKVFKQSLKGGKGWAQSCGKCSPHPNYRGYEEISMAFWGRLVSNARKRNIPLDITIERAWNVFLKQNKKCSLSGVELSFNNTGWGSGQSASLDRIDSSKGYTPENVQWLHKKINMMKQALPQEEFLEWIKKIWHYQTKVN